MRALIAHTDCRAPAGISLHGESAVRSTTLTSPVVSKQPQDEAARDAAEPVQAGDSVGTMTRTVTFHNRGVQ
jgi:hypothetical protein